MQAEDIISLNVGGVTEGFMVRRSLLCSVDGSALEAMFSGRHSLTKVDGKVFVDRNPKVFMKIIDYLRNNFQLPKKMSDEMAEQIEMEMQFWGLINEPENSEVE